jgi:L-lactate dehydrogenase complex protein LldF
MSKGMKFLFAHPVLYRNALKMSPAINLMPRGLVYNRLNGWGYGRELPRFAGESFTSMWIKGKIKPNKKVVSKKI